MNKEICFCIDKTSIHRYWDYGYCPLTYNETEEYINEGLSPIFTLSLAHLSFDLIDRGYDIYLCYKDKKVKIDRTSYGLNS